MIGEKIRVTLDSNNSFAENHRFVAQIGANIGHNDNFAANKIASLFKYLIIQNFN